MRRAVLLVTLGLLGCDDMTSQPKQKVYTPVVAPAKTPIDTVRYDDQPPAAPPLSLALLQRGQERFRIDCAPCHSEIGDGNGMVVQRGFPHPPSYHIDRLRAAPAEHFYEVITNGYGAMYSFADRVQPDDRWAIAAYIRALQRSQHATMDQVPADQRAALQ